VGCKDVPVWTDLVAQPSDDVAGAGADLEAVPARLHSELGDDAPGAGIEDGFEGPGARQGLLACIVDDIRGAAAAARCPGRGHKPNSWCVSRFPRLIRA